MPENKSQTQIQLINNEINRELSDPRTVSALLATTFKGLDGTSMKQAMMEGMIRGFKFKDFLEKNVYAIPFGKGYSLINSIDFARKRGMRAGIVGKEAPKFEITEDGAIESCTVTVKRKVDNYVGDFTATVYFSEYSTGKNQWVTKPRTMIAKVAEMHALRMACPEELSQSYVEEEMELEDRGALGREAKEKVENSDLKMGNFAKSNGKNKDNASDDAPESDGEQTGQIE